MNTAYLLLSTVQSANVGWIFAWFFTRRQFPFSPVAYAAIFLATSVAYLVLDTLKHNMPAAALDIVFIVFWIFVLRYWWRRRNRKGRLAALGNKAKARIAEMKRKMAERPARPVLRPVPQGGIA